MKQGMKHTGGIRGLRLDKVGKFFVIFTCGKVWYPSDDQVERLTAAYKRYTQLDKEAEAFKENMEGLF